MKVEEIDNGINIIAESSNEYNILERFWKNGVDIISISKKSWSLKILDRKVIHKDKEKKGVI
jgi:hypothetical protein